MKELNKQLLELETKEQELVNLINEQIIQENWDALARTKLELEANAYEQEILMIKLGY